MSMFVWVLMVRRFSSEKNKPNADGAWYVKDIFDTLEKAEHAGMRWMAKVGREGEYTCTRFSVF